MQSETGIVAVPSAADAWTTVATFTVPAGVKRLSKIRVSVAPDWGTTAGSVRMAPVFRLQGSGLLEQNPHEYLGVFGGHAEVTTGGIQQNMLTSEYDLEIPVQTGGTFDVQVNTLDEAITAGTVMANVFYDEKDIVLKNSQSQYTDAAGTTTADSWVTVGTITVPAPQEANRPSKIRMVCFGVAVDQGTSAISLRLAARFRLTGSGIGEGGSHEFVFGGQYSGQIGTTPSQGIDQDNGTVWIDVDIPVNASGTILVEHRFDVETPTASTVAAGILYM